MGNADRIKQLEQQSFNVQHFLENSQYIQSQGDQQITSNIKSEIDTTVDKLKNKKYTVAVIAAMKAGKSTLFNALLGRDILPNETAACTAAITEVKFAENESDKVLKYMQGGTVEQLKSTGEQDLAEVFLEDVRSARKGDSVSQIEKYYFEYPIHALKGEKYQGVVENFVLVDTPGPNEASTGEFDVSYLKKLTEEQIRTADAVIFVFDYQVYKSDTNAKLLKDIFAYRNMEESERDKIFFVLNKIDAITPKDPSLDQIVIDVKKMIKTSTDNKIPEPQVIPVSALQALRSRQLTTGSIDETHEFIEKAALDHTDVSVTNPAFPEAFQKTLKSIPELLLKDSKIEELEQQVIIDTFEKSSEHIIEQSKENLLLNLSHLNKEIESKEQLFEQDAESLNEKILNAQKEIQPLKKEGEPIKSNFENEFESCKTIINQYKSKSMHEVENVIRDVKVDSEYRSTSKDELRGIYDQIIQSHLLTIVNYLTTHQFNLQNVTRKCMDKINKQLQVDFKRLAEKANEKIGKELDFSIATEGNIRFTTDFNFLGDLTEAIESEVIDGQKGGVFSRAYHSVKGSLSGLLDGIALGDGFLDKAKEGFLGLFEGFKDGITGEARRYETSQTEYILKMDKVKEDITKSTKKYLKEYNEDIEKKVGQLFQSINKNIDENIDKFLKAVSIQLQELEREYQDNIQEKDKILSMYTEARKEIQVLSNKINDI